MAGSNYERQTLFPHHPQGMNFAFSDETVLLNGMKLLFDEVVALYPVGLERKDDNPNGHTARSAIHQQSAHNKGS